jgi:hypothetical protein
MGSVLTELTKALMIMMLKLPVYLNLLFENIEETLHFTHAALPLNNSLQAGYAENKQKYLVLAEELN